jgi:3'-5' exoribonuclease
VGKIHELSYERVFDYTDRGRLIGHIIIGADMIRKKVERIEGFPERLSMLLEHAVISHHGELQFGSPKRPKTIEALILHCLDDLDAKIDGFRQFIEKDVDPDSNWTPYHRMFDRLLYKNLVPPNFQEEKEGKPD